MNSILKQTTLTFTTMNATKTIRQKWYLLSLLSLLLPMHASDSDAGNTINDSNIDNSNIIGNGNNDNSKNNDEEIVLPNKEVVKITDEHRRAFKNLLYTREVTKNVESQDVSTFFVAKHFGNRHYWKIRNGQDMALGTTKKERESALNFWKCAHIPVSRLKTVEIRKRIGYDTSAQVPVTYTDKEGNEKNKEKTEFYASAKQVMEYLTGFYAPTDNPAQRKWKRKFGGVTSYQYKTFQEATDVGIHPDDYLNVYKIMKIYFAQPNTKLVYNDTSRAYVRGAVEKLMHSRFKDILELDNNPTNNNAGKDRTRKLNRPKKGQKEMAIKSLHEAAVTAIEEDLRGQGKELKNPEQVIQALDTKHENEQARKQEQGTPENENIVEPVIITNTNNGFNNINALNNINGLDNNSRQNNTDVNNLNTVPPNSAIIIPGNNPNGGSGDRTPIVIIGGLALGGLGYILLGGGDDDYDYEEDIPVSKKENKKKRKHTRKYDEDGNDADDLNT